MEVKKGRGRVEVGLTIAMLRHRRVTGWKERRCGGTKRGVLESADRPAGHKLLRAGACTRRPTTPSTKRVSTGNAASFSPWGAYGKRKAEVVVTAEELAVLLLVGVLRVCLEAAGADDEGEEEEEEKE